MDELKINKLIKILKESDNIVALTGAGISVPSEIPDFRSSNEIFNKEKFPVEEILSHNFFINHTEKFYEFYKKKMIYPNSLPNIAHKTLTKLEQQNKLNAIITQNIDGLDYEAGSKNVFELHGSIKRNYCTRCNQFYDLSYIINSNNIPKCEKCSSIIKPDVVLYEEPLNNDFLSASINYIANADTLIIGGTSLVV